ncbi:MAG: flavodoxin family protein [Pseudomonadota bacterium]
MKSMVVYSSRTGNTRKVAEAVLASLPEPRAIYPVKEAPDPEDCDFLALGCWIDKGAADAQAQAYFKRVRGQRVGVFITLGAYPDSDHAIRCVQKVRRQLDGNQVLGHFICQGAIDPELVRWMEMQPQSHPHYMDPARRERIAEAARHPDPQDLARAQELFRNMVAVLAQTGPAGERA